jgi:hypothetical protein
MFQHKRVWIKKATGLGVTEFFLYFMLWLALCRPRGLEQWLANSHMIIVAGTREETALKILKRAKDKLEQAGIQNPDVTREGVIEIGDITIQAFPSFNASWRGLDKISIILADEADFFRDSEQEEVRAVAERYIGKSKAWIALVSTPNKPGGLFERIEAEQPCLYHKLILDYNWGIGKIFTAEDIIQAKKSPQFGREYEGKYLGGTGNCFSEQKIQQIISADYNPDVINPYALKAIGVDPGWGLSSPFGITMAQFSGNRIEILEAKEYVGYHDYNVMVNEIYKLYRQTSADKVIIDGSAVDVVSSFKSKIGERPDYLHERDEYTKQGLNWESSTKCLPVHFGRQNKTMLTHAKNLVDNEIVTIHPDFGKLLTFLRTAVEKQGVIDKDRTSYHDIGDAFMMALYYFQVQ